LNPEILAVIGCGSRVVTDFVFTPDFVVSFMREESIFFFVLIADRVTFQAFTNRLLVFRLPHLVFFFPTLPLYRLLFFPAVQPGGTLL